MSSVTHDRLHATAVAINGRAVLLTGRSGSGKSDLAMRLIDRGAELVADDQVTLQRRGEQLFALAEPGVAGKIELAGVGILGLPFRAEAPVMLMVVLDEAPERLPLHSGRVTTAGVPVPAIRLSPFEASAPIKVEQALGRLLNAADRQG